MLLPVPLLAISRARMATYWSRDSEKGPMLYCPPPPPALEIGDAESCSLTMS